MAREMEPVAATRQRVAELRAEGGPEREQTRLTGRAAQARQRFEEEVVPAARLAGVTPLARGYFMLRGARRQ